MSCAALILFACVAPFLQGGPAVGDTSFTTYSASRKVLKHFPHARTVIPKLPPGVKSELDVVYATRGKHNLKLDIFFPSTDKTSDHPGVLLIHGGGWSSGDMTMQIPMAQQFAAHGYVAASIEYRLSPEALFPAAVYDIKTGIRWMRANAARYRLDTNRIAVYGCSSGGELAAFVGVTGDMKKFAGDGPYQDRSSTVQAIVDVDGLLDFMNDSSTVYDEDTDKPSAADKWLGGSYRSIPQTWGDASPINYIGRDTPPIEFINSSIPHYHAGREECILKLKANGVYYEVHSIPGTPHPFWLFHPWFETTLEYAISFLDSKLK